MRLQPREDRGALGRRLAEEHRRTHRGSPVAVASAQQKRERLAQLFRAKRVRLEERELPPIEGLAELEVLVCREEPAAQLGGEAPAELVQPRRLAVRLR